MFEIITDNKINEVDESALNEVDVFLGNQFTLVLVSKATKNKHDRNLPLLVKFFADFPAVICTNGYG